MRSLLCPDCAAAYRPGVWEMGASSAEPGEYVRRADGVVRAPAPGQTDIYVNGERRGDPAAVFVCDSCCCPLPPGARAAAVSAWISGRPAPGPWEHDYMEIDDGL